MSLVQALTYFPTANLFDRNFLTEKLTTGRAPTHFTINFEKGVELGITAGRLMSKGYSVVKNEDDSFLLSVEQYQITLREEIVTNITDFDDLHYCASRGLFFQEGKLITSELHEKFSAKKCTLTFDVYTAQDTSELWTRRRKALLWYVSENWTIFDRDGDAIRFQNLEGAENELNPEKIWVVLKKGQLTLEGLQVELYALLAKYEKVIRENYKGVVMLV